MALEYRDKLEQLFINNKGRVLHVHHSNHFQNTFYSLQTNIKRIDTLLYSLKANLAILGIWSRIDSKTDSIFTLVASSIADLDFTFNSKLFTVNTSHHQYWSTPCFFKGLVSIMPCRTKKNKITIIT